ncbi:unnamed protein product [Caenorhabditis angaria]|uniref:Uncharacterized protein n=1 Tax=Caenorhabditis angaria TaxID=860376 RepID=A0A9P1IPV5_9PELO|nr:unnamed protein product [Caenorhabditis angaria]
MSEESPEVLLISFAIITSTIYLSCSMFQLVVTIAYVLKVKKDSKLSFSELTISQYFYETPTKYRKRKVFVAQKGKLIVHGNENVMSNPDPEE